MPRILLIIHKLIIIIEINHLLEVVFFISKFKVTLIIYLCEALILVTFVLPICWIYFIFRFQIGEISFGKFSDTFSISFTVGFSWKKEDNEWSYKWLGYSTLFSENENEKVSSLIIKCLRIWCYRNDQCFIKSFQFYKIHLIKFINYKIGIAWSWMSRALKTIKVY